MMLSRSEIIGIVGIAVTVVLFAVDKLLDGYAIDAAVINVLSAMLPVIAIFVGAYAVIVLVRRLSKAVRRRRLRTAEAARSSDELKQTLRTMRIDIKVMLYVLATKGDVYCIDWQWRSEDYLHQPLFEQFMIWETLDKSIIRVRATDLLKSVVSQNADFFEAVTEETIRGYAVYDPGKKRRTSTHRIHGLDWWWYSAEPEMDQGEQFAEQIARNKVDDEP